MYVLVLAAYSLCESLIRCVKDVISGDGSVYTDLQYCQTPVNRYLLNSVGLIRCLEII